MLQLAKCNILKIQARHAVRGLGLPDRVLTAVYSAIDRVRLPFADYYRATNQEVIRAFVAYVMGFLGDVDIKNKERIKTCLFKVLI